MRQFFVSASVFLLILLLLSAGCQGASVTVTVKQTTTITTTLAEPVNTIPTSTTPLVIPKSTQTTVPTPPGIPTNTSKTYYVKTGGNDSSSGLSDSDAWATLGKVQRSQFKPGDRILLKCGSKWNERLEFPSSGTTDKYITFSSYGTGDKPKMMRLYINSKQYINVSNIYMLGDREYESCFISNCHDILIDSITADGQKLMECTKYSLFLIYRSHHVTVKNSIIKDSGNHIGTLTGGGLFVYTDCHDILIENNVSFNHVEHCMQCCCMAGDPWEDYNITFRNNTCYNEEGYSDECRGINVGWQVHDVTIEGNKVYNTKTFLIGADANLTNAIIKNNTLFYTLDDGYSIFVNILANSYGNSKNISIYNNSMFHLSRLTTGAFIRLDTYDGRTSTGHKIYNNLCVTYNPDVAFIFDNRLFDYNIDNRYKAGYSFSSPYSEFTSDYNLFYSLVSPGLFVYRDMKYFGLEAWQAVSRQDSHSIVKNPLLPGIENFTTLDKFGTSGSEKINNPSFSWDTNNWGTYFNTSAGASGSFTRTTVAGEFVSAPAGLKVNFSSTTTDSSHVLLFYNPGFSIENKKWYTLSFKAKATSLFRIPNLILTQNNTPFTMYSWIQMGECPLVTTDWQTFYYYFYTDHTAADAELCWFIGKSLSARDVFYIEDVSLKLSDGLNQLLPNITNFVTTHNSPCVDAGATLDNVSDDFLRNHRPEGAGYDIGAYEIRSN
jgi:hypothetical protein